MSAEEDVDSRTAQVLHWRWLLPALLAFALLTSSALIILSQGASQAASSYIAANPPTVIVPAGHTQGTTTITWSTDNTSTNGLLQEDHGGNKSTIDGPSWSGVTVATVLCGQPNNFTLLLAGSTSVLDSISVPTTCQSVGSPTTTPTASMSPTPAATVAANPTVTATARGSATPCSTCTATAPTQATASTTATGGPTTASERIVLRGPLTPTFLVSFPAGWNMVAGSSGTALSGYVGPLYTYQAGDTDYEVLGADGPLTDQEGYWAYFGGTGYESLPLTGPKTITINLPALQWVMIGNPHGSPATVTGADAVYVYTGAAGYAPTATLAPGQGGWAISTTGGTVTITNN
jgi:hypothetical protein